MRLATNVMIRLKAAGTLLIASTITAILLTILGPVAWEASVLGANQIIDLIAAKPPVKPELAGTTRYYRYVDGPNGPMLVPK